MTKKRLVSCIENIKVGDILHFGVSHRISKVVDKICCPAQGGYPEMFVPAVITSLGRTVIIHPYLYIFIKIEKRKEK